MKYVIEGGVNFYDELYKSLDQPEDQDNVNRCLITNSPLTDTHIKLSCSHCFNYEPLYNEFKKQRASYHLSSNYSFRVKCPYCREEPINPPFSNEFVSTLVSTKTETIYTSKNHYSYLKITEPTQSKCDYIHSGSSVTCGYHSIVKLGNDKHYCVFHKTTGIHQYLTEIKAQLKEEKQKKKLVLSMGQLSKKPKVTTIYNDLATDENIANDLAQQQTGCVQLLKTGGNKGKPCGCKVHAKGETMCLRHYNLSNKSNKELPI